MSAHISCTLFDGVLTTQHGVEVNLLKIQATCNYAFQELGEQEFAHAADELSKLTGRWQGPHGEFLNNEPANCPYCDRELEDPAELSTGLCTSDDCPRHDEDQPAAPAAQP